jgi:N-acetylglucosaminyl-diphospho-decaprenol L-rhamnosyltransferase
VLEGLVRHLDDHPDVGGVGPRLVYEDGRHQPSARRFPDVATTLVRRTPLRLVMPDSALERRFLMLDEAQPTEPTHVDWMLGAALAVRREAFDELGGFDEGYRLYCEDLDLCWRLHQRGWSVKLNPHVVVEHQLGELTRRRFLTIRTIWHVRSMLRFLAPTRAAPSPRAPMPEASWQCEPRSIHPGC